MSIIHKPIESERPAGRGDAAGLAAGTWAVVATVRAPKEMVDVFISHYLSLGADEVHVFFDDPEVVEYGARFLEDPRVKITVCNYEFWHTKGAVYPLMTAGRPDNVEARQFSNYLEVQGESVCAWILNVDVDELLISARGIAEILRECPANVFMIGARPLEAVYTSTPTIQNLFDTNYFKQPYRAHPKFVEEEFAPELLPNKYGFWGHRRGKGFFRRAERIMTLSCHFPTPLNPTLHHRLFHPELELLHFECMTFELFHEKRLRRITGDSLTTRIHRVTRARLEHFQRILERGGKEATRELYEHMNVFSGPRLARALEAGFLVKRSRLGACKARKADFQIRSGEGLPWLVDTDIGIAVDPGVVSPMDSGDGSAVRLRTESTKAGHAYLYYLSQGRPHFIIPDERGNFATAGNGCAYFLEYSLRGQRLRLRFPGQRSESVLTLQSDGSATLNETTSSAGASAAAVEPTPNKMNNPLTHQKISSSIATFLRAHALSQFKTRIWVYRNRCVVADFVHRGVGFNFDFTPGKAGAVTVDLVQRRRVGGQYLTPSNTRKRRVAADISLNEALLTLEAIGEDMISRIDAFRNSPALTTPTSVTTDKSAVQEADSLAVGVLTLPLNRNFGGNLQAYALMTAIRKMGHRPVLINRRHPPKRPSERDDPNGGLFADTYGLDPRLPNASFIDKHLSPISLRFESSEELSSRIGDYNLDAIVVGSDQVWRAKYAKSILLDFFLGFTGPQHRVIKISYAASFGADKLAYGDALPKAARLAKEFDAISVREDSGVALAERYLGVAAQHLLDPTLLLSPEDYMELWQGNAVTPPTDKLVAYILDATAEKQNLIFQLSQRLGTEAFATNGTPFSLVDALKSNEGDRSIEAWLAALHDAKFVVTDSYHGVVFSILFNKPFVAFANQKRGTARFSSLLNLLGLQERLVTDSASPDLASILTPIDWDDVNKRLAHHRTRSLSFLRSVFARKRPHAALSTSNAEPSVSRPGSSTVGPLAHIPESVLCTGCGACVSESNGSLEMAWDEDGFLVPRRVGDHVPPEAVRVCPFNPVPDEDVRDEDALARIFLPEAANVDAHAGHFEDTYIGYSREFRETSSSGGVSTYVLDQLLKRGVVDYIYVVQTDGASGYRYQACRNLDDIRSISKTRYYPVSMDELFSTIDRTEGRVAVTGVACFIKAVRLKQHYRPEYRAKIPFLLGIVCGGLKSRHYTDFLAQCTGIHGKYTFPEYRVKDYDSSASDYSFSALDSSRKSRAIKMKLVGANWGAGLFKAKACDFCTDVLTELADISLGDAWLPGYREDGAGHNIVITRTPLADEIIRSGLALGELEGRNVPVELTIKSQAGGYNHKRNGVKFRKWLADNFQPLPVPPLRDRILRDVSLADAVVQIQRERTRSKSLAYWRDTLDSNLFRKRMRASRRGLKVATAARKDGSNAPLVALLGQAESSSAASQHPEVKRHTPSRWLLQRLSDRLLSLSILRAALFGSGSVKPPRSP